MLWVQSIQSKRISAVRVLGLLVGASVLGLGAGAFADVKDGTNHQLEQTRPILMGTSGGNIRDFGTNDVDIFCCGGTLGALVTDGPKDYILSANHVLARTNLQPLDPLVSDFTDGLDDSAIHPGLIDQDKSDGDDVCTADMSDIVAGDPPAPTFVEIFFDGSNNRVDAAMVKANVAGAVAASGEIIDIGLPHVQTKGAVVDLLVTKSGRTTGQTFGKVAAINVTINVGYTAGCGSGDFEVARFVDQIRIKGKGKFGAGGDSGSLIVTDDVNHQPVALLFAGGRNDTFGNRIDNVLSQLGDVTIVGNDTPLGEAPPEEEDGGPPPGRGRGRFLSGIDPVGLEIASEVKARHEESLFEMPDVVGTGVSVDPAGNPVIEVYVKGGGTRAVGRPIPKTLEGIRVRVIETGPIRAF